jgi:hypothetical protein
MARRQRRIGRHRTRGAREDFMTNTTQPGAAVPFNKFVKKEVVYDLMRGGPGTPWENRGEHGAVGAVLKCGLRAMFKPNLLFDHIRGTTVTADAASFLWVCAGCWGLSAAIHSAIAYFMIDQATNEVYLQQYLLAALLKVAGTVGWAFLMFKFVIGLYHKLVITEIKQAVPATLTFNIVAYAMGPSILAPIPFAGPPLALVGIFIALVAGGRKRLYIGWRGAVIDALLPFVAAVVLTAAFAFVGGWALDQLLVPVEPRVPAQPDNPF